MARTQVITVRLERRPHYDAVVRVRAAYRRLRQRVASPAVSDPPMAPAAEPRPLALQEGETWLQ